MKLHISDSLALPPATVTSTVVVYGGKGMGKTNFGSVLVEELAAAHLRWSVLDPMGVWWGLRHAKDGKGKGIECLILGGAHGDIPIEPTGGSVAADLVVDEDANVIIDFSRKPNGETWGVGEKIRFITDYGRRLFQRQGSLVNGKRREPIFQVLDEAARFIPQMIRAGQPELAQCLSVWAQMVEEGRNFGLGVCLLTQRSARLNKDVAELADAMIAFRTVGPNSIGAVMDWLGEHVPKQRINELIEKLRSLPVGHCLVVSPGWLEVEKIVKIRERATFDSSATPKPGESVKRVTGEAAKPDLAKYAARMQETIERVKQNDPAELKKKLAAVSKELEQERKKKTPAEKPAAAPKVIDSRLIAQAVKKRDREWLQAVRSYQAAAERHILNASATALKSMIATAPGFEAPKEMAGADATTVYNPAKQTVRVVRPPAPAGNNGPGADLPLGEKKVLIAVAQYSDGAERDQLTILTGYKRSTRDAYLQRLGEKAYVTAEPGGLVIATEQGIAALGSDYEPLPVGEELRDYWLQRLPDGERKCLEPLISSYPNAVPRDELETLTGYKRSTRDAYLQRLASRRLIQLVGRGEVRASETLFEEAA